MNLRTILEGWIGGKVAPPPVITLIGIRCTGYETGRAFCELPAGNQHLNPMGIVHGGIIADLADAAMGVAVATVVNDNEGFSTIEMHLNYFVAVKQGLLKAVANVVRRGKRTVYLECEVRDEEDRLVAKATSTCLFSEM